MSGTREMAGTSPIHRPHVRRLRPAAFALLLAVAGLQQAHAGLFDDEEARRRVDDLSIKTNERLDSGARAQLELANQIQSLRDENARLRGQLETLGFELESAKKRQQDFYIDLDSRLRKLETQAAPPPPPTQDAPSGAAPQAAATPATDPATETREYEAALNLFKAGKVKEAAVAFDAFTKTHSGSVLAPSAQYWLGNAHYALRDCKKAIDAQRLLLATWPESPKAPDALINIATCQQELGDAKGAKTSLEAVLIKYPNSPAAATAKTRLKKK
ncbi:MAG: tol-pal system protein YbgF [Proteobacteria bacterium]|nr:tol-pal system protein YbgF [Pseudomonadota bacterium]